MLIRASTASFLFGQHCDIFIEIFRVVFRSINIVDSNNHAIRPQTFIVLAFLYSVVHTVDAHGGSRGQLCTPVLLVQRIIYRTMLRFAGCNKRLCRTGMIQVSYRGRTGSVARLRFGDRRIQREYFAIRVGGIADNLVVHTIGACIGSLRQFIAPLQAI